MAFGNATKGYVKKHSGGGGGGGTSNYNDLSNKPTINGVTLDGNKTSEDLNIGGGFSFENITSQIMTSGVTASNYKALLIVVASNSFGYNSRFIDVDSLLNPIDPNLAAKNVVVGTTTTTANDLNIFNYTLNNGVLKLTKSSTFQAPYVKILGIK